MVQQRGACQRLAQAASIAMPPCGRSLPRAVATSAQHQAAPSLQAPTPLRSGYGWAPRVADAAGRRRMLSTRMRAAATAEDQKVDDRVPVTVSIPS